MLFVDVVESVRVMSLDEDGFIARWRSFVGQVRSELLPRWGGRMVKSAGDGMLLEFLAAPPAAGIAPELHRLAARLNANVPAPAHIHLRLGAHLTDLVVEEFDVLGSGVNLAARLMTLARPGQTVISPEFRAAVVGQLDGEIEDMGECYVKHFDEPLRAFRLHPPGAFDAPVLASSAEDGIKPVLMVVAAEGTQAPGVDPMSRVLVDDLAAALARSSFWIVISRLSTQQLSGHRLTDDQLQVAARAQYIIRLSPPADLSGGMARLTVVDAKARCTLAEQAIHVDSGFLHPDSDGLREMVAAVSSAVLRRELQIAHEAALPNLPGYTVLLQGVSLLHSMSQSDIVRARDALEHVIALHPRSAEARAWMGNWHFIQIAQAAGREPLGDASIARHHLVRALDEQPEHALSLTLMGHLSSYVDGDNRLAETTLRRALACGPNESLAWLYLALLLASTGRPQEGVTAMTRASTLSPLDPLGYFFDLVAATVLSAAGRYDDALRHAERAVRLNTLHLSSWVQLIIAQVQCDRIDEARTSARRYLAVRPDASVQRFLDWHPARGLPLARSDADALLVAGLPL